MNEIQIKGGPGHAQVIVDGAPLNRLTSVTVEMRPGQAPQVTVTAVALGHDIDLSGAVLRIAGCEMPEAVEKALLEYLCTKYPMQTMVARATGGLIDVARAS